MLEKGGEFRKARASVSGACVEVARPIEELILVRDTKQHVLEFTPGEWEAFLDGVKQGEFDLR